MDIFYCLSIINRHKNEKRISSISKSTLINTYQCQIDNQDQQENTMNSFQNQENAQITDDTFVSSFCNNQKNVFLFILDYVNRKIIVYYMERRQQI